MLPTDVLDQLRAFAAAVDRRVPGTLQGVYGVGSVALGDFRPPLSNLDVVAVTSGRWGDDAVAAVRAAMGRLRRPGQAPRVACLTWEQLAGDPEGLDVPCLVGRRPLPVEELVNPLTWSVLRSAAVCVRGPEYPVVGTGDLRAWAADRLSGRWADWLARVRRRPGALLLRRREIERVLEVARLAQVVASGRVVSKLEAGELAAVGNTPNAQRVLKDAVGFRQGARMSMYWAPFERRNHAVAFIAQQTARGAVRP